MKPGLRLLLVEDDEDDYVLLRDLLTELPSFQVEIDWISSYDEAREAVARAAHALYLFDFRLGKGTGLDLLREAIAHGVEAPVILLTGQGDHEIDLEAMRAGASDYLVKRELNLVELDRSFRYALTQKEAEKAVHYMAMYDSLTGLPNRELFRDRLSQAVLRAKRHKELSAVLFVDLNNFKRINDTLGHAAGDAALSVVARRLVGGFRATDSIGHGDVVTGRFGGDEFSILITDIGEPQVAVRAAERILRMLEEPILVEGKELIIGAAIGIALCGEDSDVGSLLRNSDAAMYVAKRRRRNGYELYEDAMTRESLANLTLESDLRTALGKRAFVLHYQPIVDLKERRVVAMEALIRWQREPTRLAMPSEFIAFAEGTDLIEPIGRWVIDQACAQIKRWRSIGFRELRVAVNLSVRHCTPDLVETVARCLESWKIPGDALALEVTESIFMADLEEITEILRRLKQHGVELMIDDFGSGYFSFALLKHLPIDGIKIDRSIVQGLPDDVADMAVLKAIQSMATALGLTTVGEGVETAAQLRQLSDIGCNMGQGYVFSKPTGEEQATALLRNADRLLSGE